jgi:hypothetical protein
MVANVQPIFVKQANNAAATFATADGITLKDLIVAGAEGTKVFAANCTSDDTSTVLMQVFLHDDVQAYLLGTVPVAPLAGTDGTTSAVNLLDGSFIPGLDADGELFIGAGYKLQVAPKASVTSPKMVTVVAFGADY